MIDGSVPIDIRLVLAIATIFIAGVAKGVTGMGLPTVTMGVLGAFMGRPTHRASDRHNSGDLQIILKRR